jgi:hypothetical protein
MKHIFELLRDKRLTIRGYQQGGIVHKEIDSTHLSRLPFFS